MKTLIIFLVLCAGVQAQDFGLGDHDQKVVVRQYYSANTFGLGNPIRRAARAPRFVIDSPAVQPVVTVAESVVPVVNYVPVNQPRWRLVRQRQCTARGCQDVWVRVWK